MSEIANNYIKDLGMKLDAERLKTKELEKKLAEMTEGALVEGREADKLRQKLAESEKNKEHHENRAAAFSVMHTECFNQLSEALEVIHRAFNVHGIFHLPLCLSELNNCSECNCGVNKLITSARELLKKHEGEE